MAQATTQVSPVHTFGATLRQMTQTLFNEGHYLFSEVSAAAAHYNGLIDSIERAGWDVAMLETVQHSQDKTAKGLISELLDSYPDMSIAEQNSFLAPFYAALDQFSAMTAKEKDAFKQEYDRFKQLHSQAIQEFAISDTQVTV